ncbi:MAG: hypothetical protein IJP70_10925 [Bacteroidales bacterium]|nr:hypothetical protein [Bacteroidales bacterium]
MRKFLLFFSVALLFSASSVEARTVAVPSEPEPAASLSKEEQKERKAMRDSLKFWLKNARYYTNNKSAPDFNKARTYLDKCFQSPMGKDNLQVFRQAANTEYLCFQTERNKPASNKNIDVKVIYASTSAGFQYYSKAYRMSVRASETQEKGKSLSKKELQLMQDQAYDLFRTTQGFRANAGYYYKQKDYKQAHTYFALAKEALDDEMLLAYANSNAAMKADFDKYRTDSIRKQLIFSCAVTAVQIDDDSLMIAELEAAKTVGIESNRIYQQLCQKYLALGDTVRYEKTLIEADSVIEDEAWFAQNLLNLYLGRGDHKKALTVIDDVIQNTPGNARNVELKGRLLDEAGNLFGAEQAYQTAIGMDTTLLISYSSLGRIYYNRAVEREQYMIEQREFDDIYDVCVPLYELALPYYYKAFENDTERTDESIPEAIRTILFKRFQSPKCKNPRPLIKKYNEVSQAYGWRTL